MATHFKPCENGILYLFDKKGDGIAMHAHATPNLWHDITCISGSVEVYGDMEDVVLRAGESAALDPFRMHEIRALEDKTEIVNTLRNGTPYVGEGDSGSVEPELLGRIVYVKSSSSGNTRRSDHRCVHCGSFFPEATEKL